MPTLVQVFQDFDATVARIQAMRQMMQMKSKKPRLTGSVQVHDKVREYMQTSNCPASKAMCTLMELHPGLHVSGFSMKSLDLRCAF